MEECEIAHDNAKAKGSKHSVIQAFYCPFRLSGAYVLCDISGHGLRVGGGHKHDKTTQLFCNAYPGRRDHTKLVDDSCNSQK